MTTHRFRRRAVRALAAPAAVAVLAIGCSGGEELPSESPSAQTDGAAGKTVGPGPTVTAAPGSSTTAEPTTTTTRPLAVSAPNGQQRPAPPTSAAELAGEIETTERALRDPATPEDQRNVLGHRNQIAYRTLGRNPAWDTELTSALPPDLADVAAAHAEARRSLAAMHPNPSDVVPAWQISEPEPVDALLGYYREAEAATGIEWEYLAAINLVETGFGRIQGLSVAGARGPMQFLPSTWDEDGIGAGDIDDPHDSIQAAARYLVRRGGATDMNRALRGYNNSENYVTAVNLYADLMRRDERALWVLHAWQIYYLSSAGDLWLPTGYREPQPVPVAEYLARAPWSAPPK